MGRAQGVQTRVEGRGSNTSSVTVMTFRIVGPDGGQPAEVEIRGRTLTGSVQDGDWVELVDQRAKSGRYEVERVTNLTTGSQVATAGLPPKGVRIALGIVFAIVFLAVLGFIISTFVGMSAEF
jgi:hypothetical protein